MTDDITLSKALAILSDRLYECGVDPHCLEIYLPASAAANFMRGLGATNINVDDWTYIASAFGLRIFLKPE